MRRARFAAVVVAAVVAAVAPAHAETPRATPAAVEVDREVAPLGRVELGFDGGAPIAGGWALGARLGLIDRPLTLAADGVTTTPVARRATLFLGGALQVGERGIVDAALPLAWQHGDGVGGAALDRWVAGDLALGGRLTVAGDARRAALVRAVLTLPTGDDHAFAGEPRWTLAWQLIGRVTIGPGVVLAATGGLRLRGAEVAIGDRVVGDELTGALGVVVPIATLGVAAAPTEPAPALRATAELVGVLADSLAGSRGPSPVEARVGVVAALCGGWTLGVRFGRGLDDQLGAPRLRALLEVAWGPGGVVAPPTGAADGDGDRDGDHDDGE